MSSVARVKFIKTKVVFRYSLLPKVPQTKFHHIRVNISKFIHVQIPIPNWQKFSRLQNGAMRGLEIGARELTNWDKRDHK